MTQTKHRSQKNTIEYLLRGTKNTLNAKVAKQDFGIAKLSARICEMRKHGLVIDTVKGDNGAFYTIKARAVDGTRTKRFTT